MLPVRRIHSRLRPHAMGMEILMFLSTSAPSPFSPLKLPDGFKIPVPRPLVVTDGNYLGFLKSTAGTICRFTSGALVIGWNPFIRSKGEWPGTFGYLHEGSTFLEKCPRPQSTIIIYESEASAQSRKVREACTMLDLTVEYRPCPKGAFGWLQQLSEAKGGEQKIPYMIDGEKQLSDSDEIIRYLFSTYGPGENYIPWMLKGKYAESSCAIASSLRNNAGSTLHSKARKDTHQLKPLILWGFEGSPFTKLVRETLSSLGLAHVLINCGRGSANRERLFQLAKRFQVPYLQDPNTGIEMFESPEICKYLLSVYTA